MADLRQSSQYSQYTKTIGWQVKQINGCQVFIRRVPLIGSIIKIQRPDSIPFEKIDKLAWKYRALFVKLEPLTISNLPLAEYGFHRDSWPLLPTKTIWLDLIKTEDQLWREMEKETRSCLKRAKDNNLTIEQLNNEAIVKFYEDFRKFGRGYIPKKAELQALVKAFGKKAILLSVNGLAGTLIFIHDQRAYYYFAFTSPWGRKKFAQYLLVWQAIKMTKKLGCEIFDMEGIEDPRYKITRKWHGFSHFKKSFGGREVQFPGSFTKFYFSSLLPKFGGSLR